MNTRTPLHATADASLTAAPITPGAVGAVLPEFIEVPDTRRLYGIRRTMVYSLMKSGEIQSVLIRKPGNKSGKRLIFAKSVNEWLHRQMAAQLR